MNESTTALQTVIESILVVAPETDAEIVSLDTSVDVFEALGLDSIDHLGVMTQLADRTGVEIPEREYGSLRSIDALASRITR